MEDIIDIIVTETTNTIEITAQPNDEIIDVNIIDNREDIVLNVTPTVVEININSLTGNFGVEWGDITGTLADQTDLNNALALKANLVDGKVPSSELPSYVDDVVEVATFSALPATGEVGKIYVILDTNKIYRWSGSTYIEIADSTAVWGAITGTLSSQTDLQTALDAKQDDLNGTGFVKASGTTISYDNSTYLTTSSAATTYVPYTGATENVDLGTHTLSSHDLVVNHASGSGVAASITKGGNGEALTVVKSSGSGNAASITGGTTLLSELNVTGAITGTTATLASSTSAIALGVTLSGATGDGVKITHSAGRAFNIQSSGGGYGILINNETASTSAPFTIQKQGLAVITLTDAGAGSFASSLTANSFVKTSGTSAQFLKADGSVDSTAYVSGSGTSEYYARFTGTRVISDGFIRTTSNITYVEGMGLYTLNGLDVNGNYGAGGGGLKIRSYDETTGNAYIDFANTGGRMYLGLNRSTASGLMTNATAYATVLTTGLGTTNLEFGTNATKRMTIDGTTGAVTLTSALSGTSASFTGNVSILANSARLTVSESGGAEIRVTAGGSSGFIGTYSNHSLTFLTNSATALTIASTGAATFSSSVTATNIGINTSTLNSKLSVYKSDVTSGNSPASSGTTAVNGLAEFASNRGQGLYIGSQYSGDYGVWLQVSDKGNLGVNYPLLLQPNGGNVGIGTASPSYLLDLWSTSATLRIRNITAPATGGTSSLLFEGINNFSGVSQSFINSIQAGNSGATQLVFGTSGTLDATATERMRITSGGNVGIGTTSPTAQLDIQAVRTDNLTLLKLGTNNASTGNGDKVNIDFYSDGNNYLNGRISREIEAFSTYAGALTFATGASGSVTERMRITSGGNVGIGTTSPVSIGGYTALTLNNATTGGILTFQQNGTNKASIYNDGSSNLYLGVNSGATIFENNGSERMRITSGGNVLVGTTVDYGQKVVIRSGSTGEGNAHLAFSHPDFGAFHFLDATAYWIGQNSAYKQLRIYSGSSIYTGVYLSAGGSSWSSYSDERMKTDLMPIENATEKVASLRSVIGRYKTDDESKRRPFLIAQDVYSVLPEAVDIDQKTGMMGVQYTEVIPLLVASIKELKTELDTLKNK